MLNMACFRLTLIMLIMAFGMVKSRWLELEPYSTSPMISDGIDHDVNRENVLRVDASNSSVSATATTLYGDKSCQSSLAYLPCADTAEQVLFLVFVYIHFMRLGERWIREGSQALFLLLGDYKAIGASVFRVLMSFPRIVLVVVAGLRSTKSAAQNQVDLGVRVYAGSTVLTLTYMWGIYIIKNGDTLRGKKPMTADQHREDSSTKCLPLKQRLSILYDYGVNIDKETRTMGVMMLFSLIPFAAVYLVAHIKTSLTTILFTLIVSGSSLAVYLVYQIRHPWIHVRSLAYLKEENLRIRFFYHLPRLVEKDLVDEHGNPKLEAIKSVFIIAAEDKGGYISHKELEALIENVLNLEEDHISKDYAKAEILTHFDDDDKNGKINLSEFEKGFTKWLKKWKNDAFSSDSDSKNRWKQILKEAIRKKRESLTSIDQIMTRILKQVNEKENIVKENGDPDKEKIEELFSQHDLNRENKIQRGELQTFIESVNFGIPINYDAIFNILEHDFDKNGNHETIDKSEFVEGFIKWIHKAMEHDPSIKDPKLAIANFEEDCWAEFVPPINFKAKPIVNAVRVICGLMIVSAFSGPFTQSVLQFSDMTGMPFNITSLLMLPIIMSYKSKLPVITSKNASLRLSELYSGLVMDNLLGLFTLLVTVYMKGLSWNYTNEVLTIMIPCAVVGSFALKSDTYPLWEALSAMLVYPIYALLVELLGS